MNTTFITFPSLERYTAQFKLGIYGVLIKCLVAEFHICVFPATEKTIKIHPR